MNCFVCAEPTTEHDSGMVYVVVKPVSMFDQYGEMDYRLIHFDCMANEDKPKHLRVCDTCHKVGKSSTGEYPEMYDQPFIQHPECVDWDNIRKYRNE